MGAKEVSAFASHLAAHTLAFSWRAPFDPKSLYRIKGKNVRVSHMTRTTFGDTGGKYTTVFVAAVFLF